MEVPTKTLDPTRSSGAPIFVTGGYRVEDIVHRFWAGESMSELTQEFGVPVDHIEDAIRVASLFSKGCLSCFSIGVSGPYRSHDSFRTPA